MKKVFLSDEGLTVEAIEFKTTNDQVLALMSDEVDMVPDSSLAITNVSRIGSTWSR
jgi:hypothetical protein